MIEVFFPDGGVDVARSLLFVGTGVFGGLAAADLMWKRLVRRSARDAGAPDAEADEVIEIMKLDSLGARLLRWGFVLCVLGYIALSLILAIF